MKTSIAMATYNGSRYLYEQLESLAAQERLPDELVVCDDGSTDDTPAILRDFAASAPFPVHVHRNESNLGYVANFGKALSLTSGDLVFLSDQDDVWLPGKLAAFEERALAQPSALLLVCDLFVCDEALTPGVRVSDNLRRLGGLAGQNINGCCTAVRRDFLSLVLPMPGETISHDNWIHTLARAIGGWSYIDVPLQYWRRHGRNLSATSISSLHGISAAFRLRHLLNTSFRDPVPHWLRRSGHVELVRARLLERRSEFEALVGSAPAERALGAIDNELETLGERIAIVRLGRRRRLRKVLKHLRSGGYSGHRGFVSALKDLVRPRSGAIG